MKKSILIMAVAVAVAGVSFAEEEGWVNLFDGKTLDGWENPYDWGNIEIVDCEIHLQAEKKFFLCTKKKYKDFIFEAEILMPDKKGNSGFMFRCHKEHNKVFGYQAEVDTGERAWAGGLYDEGRRQWLNPQKPVDSESGKAFTANQGRAFKQNEWNKYRIQCEGDKIKIFVNDTLTSEYRDSMDREGYIGIQHHGEKGLLYRFRNIRIKELVPATE